MGRAVGVLLFLAALAGFGFRIQPYRMVNASSTGSERSR